MSIEEESQLRNQIEMFKKDDARKSNIIVGLLSVITSTENQELAEKAKQVMAENE